MNVRDAKGILEYLTDEKFYINSFPLDKIPCLKFILSDTKNDRDLETLYIRIMSKATHPLEAEELLSNLIPSLKDRTSEVVNDHQVVLTVLESNSARYEGVTDSGEYMYSLEVRIIVLVLGGV